MNRRSRDKKGSRNQNAFSKRMNSIFSVGATQIEEEEFPVAKVDISLVGVEHAGKTTFFKQITSMYNKEDFNALIRTDGRSQAMGRMLKITLTVLKPIVEQLEREDAKVAAKVLLKSYTLYSLTPSTSKALKVVWSDPVFYAHYRKSPFFQANDLRKDVEQCEQLLDDKFVIPKSLHLKLHNATHGYNSSKFNFISTQRIFNAKSQNEARSMPVPVLTEVEPKARRRTARSDNAAVKKRRESVAGSIIASSKLFRSKVSRSVKRAFSKFGDDALLQKRKNEVRIWDIGGLFERRTDWEYFLRRSNLTFFFVSLSDYSTVTEDGSGENLMQDSLNMFQVLCESEFLRDQVIQVVLTKKDIFAEKMRTLKIPLNISGLFPDAPSGDEEFDIDCNIDYIKELFLKVTETENSFLTRENVKFSVLNMFEDIRVKEFFVDSVTTIRAEEKIEEVQSANRESKSTEAFLEELNKVQRPRGFSMKLKSVGQAIRRSLRSHSSVDPTGIASPRNFYPKAHRKSKRRSRKYSAQRNKKSSP